MKTTLKDLTAVKENSYFVIETPENTFRIKKEYDDTADSPRDGLEENLGTMVCWHRCYTLGDKHDFECPGNFLDALVLKTFSHEELHKMLLSREYGVHMSTQDGVPALVSGRDTVRCYTEEEIRLGWPEEDFVEELSVGKKRQILSRHPDVLLMPLYLYDHSGITISTSEFCDPWDSGQRGFIYTTRARYEAFTLDRGNPDWKTKAAEYLKAEVSSYDEYLQGFCYYVSIDEWCGPDNVDPEDFLTAEPYWNSCETCGGFLGADDTENGVLDFIAEIVA